MLTLDKQLDELIADPIFADSPVIQQQNEYKANWDTISNHLHGYVHFQDDMYGGLLESLLCSPPTTCYSNLKIREYKRCVAQECHAVSAYIHLTDTDRYKIVTGFAAQESCCESEYHWHTWVLDTKHNCVIEPTPLIRQDYFGTILTDDQAKIFCKEIIEEGTRFDRIKRARFIVYDRYGKMQKVRGRRFKITDEMLNYLVKE